MSEGAEATSEWATAGGAEHDLATEEGEARGAWGRSDQDTLLKVSHA